MQHYSNDCHNILTKWKKEKHKPESNGKYNLSSTWEDTEEGPVATLGTCTDGEGDRELVSTCLPFLLKL
jgi:hypothetical protein